MTLEEMFKRYEAEKAKVLDYALRIGKALVDVKNQIITEEKEKGHTPTVGEMASAFLLASSGVFATLLENAGINLSPEKVDENAVEVAIKVVEKVSSGGEVEMTLKFKEAREFLAFLVFFSRVVAHTYLLAKPMVDVTNESLH